MQLVGGTSKVVGEGGSHLHKLALPKQTQVDGIHKHLFFVNDRLLMSDLSGEHYHPIDLQNGTVGAEVGSHKHKVSVNTTDGVVDFTTEDGSAHTHELQTDSTTLSGLHIHTVKLGDQTYPSLLPHELLDEVQSAISADSAFKGFLLKRSADPMEMDFQTVKTLNRDSFKEVLRKSVFCSIVKSLSRLAEGLQVESLVLSRERFFDIGTATRFVLDAKLAINGAEEKPEAYIFNVRAKERFDESSLQRVRLTDGVEAVVGLLAEEEDEEGDTIESDLNSLGDKNKDENMKSLKERFSALASDESKVTKVTKSEEPKEKKPLINFKTKTAVGSGVEISAIMEKLGIKRKFVTVERPEKRFIEYITNKFELVNAVYSDMSVSNENQTTKYESFEVKSEHVDVLLIKRGRWDEELVIFFDDPEKIDPIFKTEILNHEFGAYEYVHTRCGPALLPVVVDKTVKPILDEDLLKALERDTSVFFSERVETFFKSNHLPYKRGVLMYGPPRNGKTTFIKHFVTHFEKAYSILCEPSNFDGHMAKFLEQSLGKEAKKVIVFEDVDSICDSWSRRSEFLNFLDGACGVNKTLFIATTNYPGHLDSALTKRPSRFDQKYKIDLPNESMRKRFLKSFFPGLDDVDLSTFARETSGFSGAYFKELFILKGMQECSLGDAVKQVKASMEIKKSAPVSEESVKDLMFDNMDIKQMKNEAIVKAFYEEKDLDSLVVEDEPKEETKNVSLRFDICKQDEEKRLVYGPVLVPENFDLQDDIISKEEIEKANHNYMVKLNFREDPEFLKSLGLNDKSRRGFMHVEMNRKIALVENYIAPVDFKMGERSITAGTWVMAVKVFDDEIWNLVKAKRITGFSIGGRSQSIPVEG